MTSFNSPHAMNEYCNYSAFKSTEISTNYTMDYHTPIEADEARPEMPWTMLCMFLIPYIVTLCFALPRTYIVSVIHRISGINTLLITLFLMLYESYTQKHPPFLFYAIGIVSISVNCIYGGLLIPKRIHRFDIPTIRAFVVGVTLGLSFVCLSLNFYFGHIAAYEPIGKCLAVVSLIGLCYAINDS